MSIKRELTEFWRLERGAKFRLERGGAVYMKTNRLMGFCEDINTVCLDDGWLSCTCFNELVEPLKKDEA